MAILEYFHVAMAAIFLYIFMNLTSEYIAMQCCRQNELMFPTSIQYSTVVKVCTVQFILVVIPLFLGHADWILIEAHFGNV